MRFLTTALACLLAFSLPTFSSPALESRVDGIDRETYDDLVLYAKYSSAVYRGLCPRPLGNTLVSAFNNPATEGFVVRDDNREEIIVAFEGTHDLEDLITDLQIPMTPLRAIGVVDVGDSAVHTGFLSAYNLVASTVLSTIEVQVACYPSYKIVVTGHSLGGAVASIAALSIKGVFPDTPLTLYTYGQPRTGNAGFTSLVEDRIGIYNTFRAVHNNDLIPAILPMFLGYRHFASEYWNFAEPASPSTVKRCKGGEDPTCSVSIPFFFLNIGPHLNYFDQVIGINPLLCI